MMQSGKKLKYSYKKAHNEAELRELLWFIPLVEQDMTPKKAQREITKRVKKDFMFKKIKKQKKR